MKMAAVLLLLLSVGALLVSSRAQDNDNNNNNYDRLPLGFKKGVDLALEKLHSHSGIQHRFRFFRSLLQSDIEPGFNVKFIYHHFYLKATNCPRATSDLSACQFRNDRPLIDCGVCYKTFSDEIEQDPKPYIHCVHKTTLTQEMKTARVEHCNRMGYSSGAPTLLAATGTE